MPTKPVMFDGIVLSKYGPVPGVGNSCRKSVKNRFEPAKQQPANKKEKHKGIIIVQSYQNCAEVFFPKNCCCNKLVPSEIIIFQI